MDARRKLTLCRVQPRRSVKRGRLLVTVALALATGGNCHVLAADPVASFQADVRITSYNDDRDNTKAVTMEQRLEGFLFSDGFHVQSPAGSLGGRSSEASAVVSNTVYTLLTRGPRGTSSAYQALVEKGIASRFVSSGLQVVALSLASEGQWEQVARGDTKVVLTLGEPIPEFFNTYLLDRTGWPNRLQIEARAPNFVVGSTGVVAMPKPYDDGFKYWTLEISYANGKPASAGFKTYWLLESAAADAQAGRMPEQLEALSTSVDVAFRWDPVPNRFGRLPAPPTLPFKFQDHRYVYDTYTNNRASLMVEGAAVLSCSNADWSYPVEMALQASSFVQRGLEARDATLRRRWLRPVFFTICAAALALPALLVWRKGNKPTKNKRT